MIFWIKACLVQIVLSNMTYHLFKTYPRLYNHLVPKINDTIFTRGISFSQF